MRLLMIVKFLSVFWVLPLIQIVLLKDIAAEEKKVKVEKISKPKVDKLSGLIIDDAGIWEIVRGNCIACHSTTLVTQNRMNRESWLETIRWMQKTQGLWPLGDAEDSILDYLSKYYAPEHHSPKIRKPIY